MGGHTHFIAVFFNGGDQGGTLDSLPRGDFHFRLLFTPDRDRPHAGQAAHCNLMVVSQCALWMPSTSSFGTWPDLRNQPIVFCPGGQ